jgi:hypothetical protein
VTPSFLITAYRTHLLIYISPTPFNLQRGLPIFRHPIHFLASWVTSMHVRSVPCLRLPTSDLWQRPFVSETIATYRNAYTRTYELMALCSWARAIWHDTRASSIWSAIHVGLLKSA